MNNRAFSLDALRGYAILTMILSATVVYGILPGWMYHAQLPPPAHAFNPDVYGITWVDLVFPFFLFAMGAAFPFSIGSKLDKGVSEWKLVWDNILRALKMVFFAIFLEHMYPWVISSPQDARSWLITLSAFALLFPMFMRLPWNVPERIRILVHAVAYGIGTWMMLTMHYANDRAFSLYTSNIIILILANMAFFGAVCFIFTYKKPLCRLLILPFLMGIFLGSQTEGSWQKYVFDFSPFAWMYRFDFLKYLFIVIPGSIAGDYLKDWIKSDRSTSVSPVKSKLLPGILVVSVALIVFNLYCLYMRFLNLNFLGSIVILSLLAYMLRVEDADFIYWRKLFKAGALFLMLGLCFEAFEGGIRKDHATYSYYFVTSGMAFISLIALSVMCDVYKWKAMRPFVMSGQNPMIAYVAVSMVVMPILNLAGLARYLSVFSSNCWLAFLQGVILTAMAMCIAVFFAKIKWFWRT